MTGVDPAHTVRFVGPSEEGPPDELVLSAADGGVVLSIGRRGDVSPRARWVLTDSQLDALPGVLSRLRSYEQQRP
ncbi:hypothetical protein CSH63_17940 [Micromonospora tulbaghiae]|uniref:DUF397 domain-containing protein n=1 Tax=Micromonospora tulbaghiae TaxID=479978 RepID=A0A386WNB2_9ACTN|nr:hypothetical protein [Micromonospora tulbaghiae]AYF29312.1 hypothetical protein CSH63_17940 [Micromonospora tulbaghiae]